MKVFSNTAVSLDGRINTRERRFVSLGSAEDHRRMSMRRSEADAVLVGGTTFRLWPHASLPENVGDQVGDRVGDQVGSHVGAADRVGPSDASPSNTQSAAPPISTPLWNIVVTRTLDVPLSADFLTERRIRPLFLTSARSIPRSFPADVEVWAGDGDLPVMWILERLRDRGIERLLVEAGGTLMYQFLAADAIDEMFITLCPLAIGGDAPSLVDGAGFTFDAMRRFRLERFEVVGDEIFLRYASRRAGGAAAAE